MKDKCCKGACKCAESKTVVLNDVEQLRKISGEIYKDMAERAEKLGRMFKALKILADFLTEEQNELKDKYEDLNRILEKKTEAKPEKKVVGEEPCETLARALFTRSKYDFSGVEEFMFTRNKAEDTDDTIAFDLVVFKSTKSQADANSTIVATTAEKRTVYLYPDMNKSVAEFDKAVGSMAFCRPPLKESCLKKEEPKCEKKCGKCRCHKDKKVENAVNALTTKKQLDGFKRFLIEHSSYAIPVTRMAVLFDKVDKKSQKFVYELRFYQGNLRKDDTHYERVPLRIRMNGDCDERILDRFDKAVSELKFNSFQEKKVAKTTRKK